MGRFEPGVYKKLAEQAEARRKRVLSILARGAMRDTEVSRALEQVAWELKGFGTEASLLRLETVAKVARDISDYLASGMAAPQSVAIDALAGLSDRLLRCVAKIPANGTIPDLVAHELTQIEGDLARLGETHDVARADAAQAPMAGRRVAILDDSEIDREMVALELKERGFHTAVAQNLAALARVLATFEPDVIVVDVMMPDIQGDDICRTLKRHFNFPTTPVILVSSMSPHKLKERAEYAGADGYAPKEEGVAELVRVLIDVVQSL